MPSPLNRTTLAVVLGASEWTIAPQDFPGSEAFTNAATDFKQYLSDPHFFGLAPENLLDLFDTDLKPPDILRRMTTWIRQRLSELKEEGERANTLLFYFVGHADFAKNGTLYCLAVQSSSRDWLDLSGIPAETLLRTFTKTAPQLSQILIFDCCYAASAFQRQGPGAARRAIEQAVDNAAIMTGKGIYFLCSSGRNVASLIASNGSYPLFSQALLQVLRQGNPQQPDQLHLSIQEVAELTEQVLREMPGRDIPIPEYSSTDRQRGDIAKLPLFPNPAAKGLQQDVDALLPPIPRQVKRLRPPSVIVVSILLILILLGGTIGIYGAVTGHLPWKASHTPIASGKTAQATVTVTAAAAVPVSPYDTYVSQYGIMFGFNAQHTRTNLYERKLKSDNVWKLQKKWAYLIGSDIDSSPPAVANGLVYIGSQDGKLYAFDAATGGQPKWVASTGGAIDSSPAVANGLVYVGSQDGNLYAFDAATGGQPKGVANVGNSTSSSPTIANGLIYIGSDNGNLYAFNAAIAGQSNWVPKWVASTNPGTRTGQRGIASSPAVANGLVYVSSRDGNLYAFDAATGGQPKWVAATKGIIDSSPAVANGFIYVGSQDGKLYAFDANTGQPKWSVLTGSIHDSSPAVANNLVYIGSFSNHSLYAFVAATGHQQWVASMGDAIYSSPTVANGLVYVGSFDGDGKLYAFAAATGGQPKWSAFATSVPGKWGIDSSPAVANGFVYVGSRDGKLYAFSLP